MVSCSGVTALRPDTSPLEEPPVGKTRARSSRAVAKETQP